jgi:hypothetical protein
MRYPVTPDGRYFIVKGQLWRCSDPALPEAERERLVHELMKARSDVRRGGQRNDSEAIAEARQRVHQAKVSLGERGPVWWSDGAPDYNRHKVENTPYLEWYRAYVSEESG